MDHAVHTWISTVKIVLNEKIGVLLKNIPKVLLSTKYRNCSPRSFEAFNNFVTLPLSYRLLGKVKLGGLRCVLSVIFNSILYGVSFLMIDHDN
jgi:hypothetical protein